MTRILAVDDHVIVLGGVRQLLTEGLPGAQIEEASDYAAAIRALESRPPELLVLDLSLPGRGGLELLDEVRRRWPRLAVVVLSGHAEEEFAVRCLRLGAAGFVSKDAGGGELLAAARKALAGGRYVSAMLAERLADLLGDVASREPTDALSSREVEVLRLLASGMAHKEIAAQLHVGVRTVATYRARLSRKLGLETTAELVRFALRHGLVE